MNLQHNSIFMRNKIPKISQKNPHFHQKNLSGSLKNHLTQNNETLTAFLPHLCKMIYFGCAKGHFMKKLFLSMGLLFGSPLVLACSVMPPEFGFVYQFDRNRDGQLNRQEWRQIPQEHNYLIQFQINNLKDFKYLDRNKNRKIAPQEIQYLTEYRRPPCADWEEKMQQMLLDSQKKTVLKKQIIDIYQSITSIILFNRQKQSNIAKRFCV